MKHLSPKSFGLVLARYGNASSAVASLSTKLKLSLSVSPALAQRAYTELLTATEQSPRPESIAPKLAKRYLVLAEEIQRRFLKGDF